MAQSALSAQQQRMVALVSDIYSAAEGIEYSLLRIFMGLSDGPEDQSRAIFYSQLNPRARRDMISTLASVSLMNAPKELDKILRLLKRARNAANKRNVVAHGEWRTDITVTPPEYKRGTVSADSRNEVMLDETELTEILKYIDEVATELFQYVMENRRRWVFRRNAWRRGASAP